MRSTSCVLAVLLATCAHIQAQTGPAGTWQAQSTPSGATWTMALRVNGSVVTGSVSSCGSPRASGIYEGTVQGNTLTFKCTSPDGDRTVAFRGTINGDEIVFSREGQVRRGGIPFFRSDKMFGPEAPSLFTAKRVAEASVRADAAVTEVADHVRTAPAAVGVVYYEEGAALRPLPKASVSGRATATAEIEGAASTIRLPASPLPVFRVCGVDPSRYKLYALRSSRQTRALETQRAAVLGGSTVVMPDREVAATITSTGGNCFALTPKRALDRGEYGVHPLDSNDVFDFGIDPVATR